MDDVKNFSEEVIKKSYTIPVLVDFWARWCSACKVLSPTLELLKERHMGEWVLAKVEVDDHPQIAIQYAVTSIPSVKLFVEGKVADEFTGAIPGHVIEEWLINALPPKHQSELHKADQLIKDGHEIEAELILSKITSEEPENKEAKVLLAKSIVLNRPSDALSLVKNIEVLGPLGHVIDTIHTLVMLLTRFKVFTELPNSPAKPFFAKAITALFSHDFNSSLENMLESLKVDKNYLDGFVREACIALFNYLGESNTLTIKYRQIFGRILW